MAWRSFEIKGRHWRRLISRGPAGAVANGLRRPSEVVNRDIGLAGLLDGALEVSGAGDIELLAAIERDEHLGNGLSDEVDLGCDAKIGDLNSGYPRERELMVGPGFGEG